MQPVAMELPKPRYTWRNDGGYNGSWNDVLSSVIPESCGRECICTARKPHSVLNQVARLRFQRVNEHLSKNRNNLIDQVRSSLHSQSLRKFLSLDMTRSVQGSC